MGSRRSAGALLVILVAVLVAVVGYLTYADEGGFFPLAPQRDQSGPAGQMQPAARSAARAAPNESKPGPKPVDWDSLIPSIRTALKQGLPGEDIERHYPIRIVKEADITGDGIPEALVYTGNGGAYTDDLTLMRIEGGRPVVARFKNPDGKIAPSIFLQGASVRHGASTQMLPDEKAIYSGGYETNDTGTGFNSCGVSAYRWNAETKTFDWDRALSKETTRTYCVRTAQALPHQ